MMYREIPAGFAPAGKTGKMLCPRCGGAFTPAAGSRKLFCPACSFSGSPCPRTLFRVTDYGNGFVHVEMDAVGGRQTLVLDLRDRRMLLEENDGESEWQEDIGASRGTERRRLLNSDVLLQLEERRPLREALREALLPYWEQEGFPYETCELDGEKLLRMVRFPGRNGAFLDALPVEVEGGWDETLFGAAERAALDPDLAVAALNGAGIRGKQLRTLVLQRPQLLFYLPQIRQLLDGLGNYDRVVRLLKADAQGLIPGRLAGCADSVVPAMRDLCEKTGQAFVNGLTRRPMESLNWTERIASSSPVLRSRLLEGENRCPDTNLFREMDLYFPWSVAAERPDVSLTGEVNGYRFVRLLSSRDYRQAGKEMRNCLGQLNTFLDGGVLVVKQGSRFAAALQVKKGTLHQAYAPRNLKIEEADPELAKAVKLWIRQRSLDSICRLDGGGGFLQDLEEILW